MSSMDLNIFYQHALQIKHLEEEAERLADLQRLDEIRAQWKEIARIIREAFPIKGMAIMETEREQFKAYPDQRRLFDLDCVFDKAAKEQIKQNSGELLRGVIRVRVYWDREAETPSWEILKYVVLVDGRSTEFDNPIAAFLAVYPSITSVIAQKA